LSAVSLGHIINCFACYESFHTSVIVGDLNLPKINWLTVTYPTDNFHKPISTFFVESSYSQLVGFPAHADNILDVVLTSDDSIFSYIEPDVQLVASYHTSEKFTITLSETHADTFPDTGQNVYKWSSLMPLNHIYQTLIRTRYVGCFYVCVLTSVQLYVPSVRINDRPYHAKRWCKYTSDMHKCTAKNANCGESSNLFLVTSCIVLNTWIVFISGSLSFSSRNCLQNNGLFMLSI